MKDVSEALRLIEAALHNMAASAKNLPGLCVLKRLMAVAYSMLAIYSWELNPLSQGSSVLLIQLCELISRVSAYLKQSVPTAEFPCFIMNRGMSHFLCPVFFPSEILSHTRQLLDSAANPLEYWEDNMRLYSGSMMEA